ncbi:MAG: hypothetical protein SF029_14705 [bacterium]|nr:hypothetical protein [bacterium]
MGATIRWCDKSKRVLYCGLDGKWTAARLYTTMDTIWQGVQNMSHPVHVILDLRNSYLTIEDHDLIPKWCPSNLGTVVIVGRTEAIYNVYGAFLWHSTQTYLSVEVRAMRTPEAAYQFLISERVNRTEHVKPML